MVAHLKFRRRQLTKIVEAAGEVEDAFASLALKMMMVRLVGSFVSDGLTRNFHGFDFAGQ